LVIVGSILLAFTIDAAWEQSRETAEVAEAIESVRGELTANRAYFETIETFHRRVADGGLEMLALTGPSPAPEAEARVKFLIGELWLRAGLDRPSTGSLEALVASGRLSQIEDPELRQALSQWQDYVARQFEIIDGIGSEGRFSQIMVQHVAQLDIDLLYGMGVFQGAKDEFVARAPRASSFESDYSALLSDREFENAVTTKTTGALMGAELTRQARDRIDAIIALIDRELGGG
jgi:hypothetical protein